MNIVRLNRELELQNRCYPDDHMVEIPRALWPSASLTVSGPERVFRCRRFLAQTYPAQDSKTLGSVLRVSVCRTTLDDVGRWRDQIDWDDLQRIKAWVGYGVFDAIEMYPSNDDVVNVANMRHLWVLLESRLDFAWRAADGAR